MQWTDIEQLVALERELFPDDAWTAPTWWAELAARPRRDYVVEEGPEGAIDGYAGVDLGGEVADVMTMAVAPAAQRRGLGRRLLDELVARAEGDHAAYLVLEVRDDNLAARKLYETRGFELLNTRRRYYQPGDVDAQVLRLTLAGAR
jgi:ribosomal-protein-alanine N-acetyltransferase